MFRMHRTLFWRAAVLCAFSVPAWAAKPQLKSSTKPAVVPTEFQWVRSFETDGFVQESLQHESGVQHVHMRLRYLDPDVNAFVGMQLDVDHFNRDVRIGNPDNPFKGNVLFDMGAHIGLVRSIHTWDLALMGVTAAGKLGPAIAITGEHAISHRWMLYHKTQVDIFVGDAFLDQDQGVTWKAHRDWSVTAGYRLFISPHINQSGPHIGLRYEFESLKIPFIFPSLG